MTRNLIVSLAATLCLATAPALASTSTDLFCAITDTAKNSIVYSFTGNSRNANGSDGGTVVETGFEKNGIDTMSPVGKRPIWVFSANNVQGYTYQPRNQPSWALIAGHIDMRGGMYHADAMLVHNGRFAGSGYCVRALPAPTGATVPDLGGN